ncbi:MAG: DoxX family protein [Candidatus Omnitrophota bacterium]
MNTWKKNICSTHVGLGVMFLRLFLAWVFITSGTGKLFGWFGGFGINGFSGFLEKIGIGFPVFNAYLVGWTELICGILLLFGFLTRFASIFIIIIMTVAIVKVHFNDLNYPAVVLLSALALFEIGSGAFSIDRLITKK